MSRNVLVAWFVTRLAIVVAFLTVEWNATSDFAYFAQSVDRVGDLGTDEVLREYPPLVLALCWVVRAASGGSASSATVFGLTLFALMLCVDVWFLSRLDRWGRRAGHPDGADGWAAWAWLLGVPALGATALLRLDLLPAVLTAVALFWSVHEGRRAGQAWAVAVALKYWPLITAPALALVSEGRQRRQVVVWAAISGAVLLVASALLGGPSHLWSPWRYQTDRGLQYESVWATPLVLLGALGDHRYVVAFRDSSMSVEIAGPGAATLATVSTACLLLVVVGLAVIAWRRVRPEPIERRRDRAIWFLLASIAGYVVAGKVLSPQYVMWLLAPTCVALVMMGDPVERAALRRWTVGLGVAALLTHLVFPLGYTLTGDERWWAQALIVVPLVGRNVALVVLFGVAAWHAAGGIRGAVPGASPGTARSARPSSRASGSARR